MLDTLKVGIPLTQPQHTRIREIAAKADRWQWVMHNEASGELLFRRISGLATTDQESFHRELRWDIPPRYSDDCKLFLEFSVPKYWYGHNIRLLYDFVAALQHLKRSLESQFGMKGRGRLLDVMQWHVSRIDACYAWDFRTQRAAQSFLDSLKRLHFPHKSPVIYPTAILFKGSTYSIKFYLKHPEFRSHDMKELLKAGASLEWINYCEEISEGVLRYEATLRQRYLKWMGIRTISDLVQPLLAYKLDSDYQPQSDEEKYLIISKMTYHYFMNLGLNSSSWENLLESASNITIGDGLVMTVPAMEIPINEKLISFPGGTLTYKEVDKLTDVLQSFLTKFVGANAGMQQVDEIKELLMKVYKPVKAARLVSFWLYVQKFGSSEAKEVFGRNSYYCAKSDLKKVGVTLIEPQNNETLTVVDREVLQNFIMQVPSEHAVNKRDDFRDSGNILNFVPKMSNLG